MFKYFPHSEEDIKKMLEVINVSCIDDLFMAIPKELIIKDKLNLPEAKSENEVKKEILEMAKKNKELLCFAGAGSYDVYIPSIINTLTSRQEFLTAYTPYQPEISQGTLQYIFEYQSMMCELTGLDVSNASMYDVATASAECMFMMTNQTKRVKVLLSSSIDKKIRKVIETYAKYRGIGIDYFDSNNIDNLKDKLTNEIAGVFVQYPDFFGVIEDYSLFGDLIHGNGSLFTMICDPSTLSILKTPGELKADIACGSGQSLGIPLSFGGPYVGYISARNNLLRKMPGRIVGLSHDNRNNVAYVLTIQAREQHIRRQKANSNICSNQSLMALENVIYCAVMGKEGLQEVAKRAYNNTHYLVEELVKTTKFSKVSEKPFFKECLLKYNGDLNKLHKHLIKKGILGGVIVDNNYLVCASETRTLEEISKYVWEVSHV